MFFLLLFFLVLPVFTLFNANFKKAKKREKIRLSLLLRCYSFSIFRSTQGLNTFRTLPFKLSPSRANVATMHSTQNAPRQGFPYWRPMAFLVLLPLGRYWLIFFQNYSLNRLLIWTDEEDSVLRERYNERAELG